MDSKHKNFKQNSLTFAFIFSLITHVVILFALQKDVPQLEMSFRHHDSQFVLNSIQKTHRVETVIENPKKAQEKIIHETKPLEESTSDPQPTQQQIVTQKFEDSIINFPAPNYPLIARRRGQEGIVALELIIDKKGLPKEVILKKSSGHPILDKAALEAAKKWRFRPSRQFQIAYYAVEKTIEFKLQ